VPTYLYSCDHTKLRFSRITKISEHQTFVKCRCGAMASQIITAPMVVIPAHMRADALSGYESPIDGRHITNQRQRREDMARNDCVEYEPGMKQDVDRRVSEDDKALDKAVDKTIESAIEKMPAAKLERLEAEMNSGVVADVMRI